MVIAALFVIAVIYGVVRLIRKNIEREESLETAYSAIDRHKSEIAFWRNETKRIQDQRDAIQYDNEKMQKAASKLVMQVAESFGKEATKPSES